MVGYSVISFHKFNHEKYRKMTLVKQKNLVDAALNYTGCILLNCQILTREYSYISFIILLTLF